MENSLLICLLGSYAGFINALWTVTVAFGLAGIFSLLSSSWEKADIKGEQFRLFRF